MKIYFAEVDKDGGLAAVLADLGALGYTTEDKPADATAEPPFSDEKVGFETMLERKRKGFAREMTRQAARIERKHKERHGGE